jgi:hypothetical protein
MIRKGGRVEACLISPVRVWVKIFRKLHTGDLNRQGEHVVLTRRMGIDRYIV